MSSEIGTTEASDMICSPPRVAKALLSAPWKNEVGCVGRRDPLAGSES